MCAAIKYCLHAGWVTPLRFYEINMSPEHLFIEQTVTPTNAKVVDAQNTKKTILIHNSEIEAPREFRKYPQADLY